MLIKPGGSPIGIGGAVGEAQVDDLDLVAALGVEADGGADQGGDAVDLFLGCAAR